MMERNRRALHDALEAELARVRLSASRKAAILAAAGEARSARRGGRPWRVGLTAAALCAALVMTAVAASPSLREALAHMLGGFEPYAQEVEGVAATDQGIRLRVVRALACFFTLVAEMVICSTIWPLSSSSSATARDGSSSSGKDSVQLPSMGSPTTTVPSKSLMRNCPKRSAVNSTKQMS